MHTIYRTRLWGAAIVALGLALSGAFVGMGMAAGRAQNRTVTVRGLAERDVVADMATWAISIQANGTDIGAVQEKSDRDAASVEAFLHQHGFSGQEILPRGISVSQYRDNTRQLQVTIQRKFMARTADIGKMEKAYADQAELLRKGVAFDSDMGGARYVFTKLNSVKPAMIAEATEAARKAANQFARDSETKVGSITRAQQGLFTITGRDGDDSSGGESPFKKVRVVTTVDFLLQ